MVYSTCTYNPEENEHIIEWFLADHPDFEPEPFFLPGAKGENGMATMRLDKFLGCTGCCSRAEAKRIIRSGGVSVNGIPASSAEMKIVPETDTVTFGGKTVVYRRYTYILMNKPQGVVSATEDGRERTVIDLLPDGVKRSGLFPCGRLDKNTVGLMLLTDNGDLAHRLLAPKSHVDKTYYVEVDGVLDRADIEAVELGITLADGYTCLPGKLDLLEGANRAYITLREGKYHQIKRMMAARGKPVIYLKRIRFGPLELDEQLSKGSWRPLTCAEIEALFRQ